MKVMKGISLGIMFGTVLSFFISIMFMMFALGFGGGGIQFLFAGNWLYNLTLLLFLLTLSLFGIYIAKREKAIYGKLRHLSQLSAFLFCISFVFFLFTQGITGEPSPLFGEGWLYFATPIPFMLVFALLGLYFIRQQAVTNKKLWLFSLLSALFITLFSGTIGALFGEYIVRGGSLKTYTEDGYIGVNVEGILVWGTVYALILLPFTTLLARLFIQVFYVIMQKGK